MSIKQNLAGPHGAKDSNRSSAGAAPALVTRRQAWRCRATRRITLVGALAAATIAIAGPATASASSCPYPRYVSAYYTNSDILGAAGVDPYSVKFTAEICSVNASSLRYVWYGPSITSRFGDWVETDTKGVFRDPNRYGGSYTFWANVTASYPFTHYSEPSYYRIWIKYNGQAYVYAGL
jgi:hypothetical protein